MFCCLKCVLSVALQSPWTYDHFQTCRISELVCISGVRSVQGASLDKTRNLLWGQSPSPRTARVCHILCPHHFYLEKVCTIQVDHHRGRRAKIGIFKKGKILIDQNPPKERGTKRKLRLVRKFRRTRHRQDEKTPAASNPLRVF